MIACFYAKGDGLVHIYELGTDYQYVEDKEKKFLTLKAVCVLTANAGLLVSRCTHT